MPGDRAGKDRKGRSSETKGDSVVNDNGGFHGIHGVFYAFLMEISRDLTSKMDKNAGACVSRQLWSV
jgi:hypothetical protein